MCNTVMDSKCLCNSITFQSACAMFTNPKEPKWMPEFSDVVISSEENYIAAHRIILAAHSDFFKMRLKNEALATTNYCDGNSFTLTIDGIKWHCIEAVVEFMYSAHITITSENVYDLVECSDYFCMPEIKKFCLDFLETYLCSDNCISIMEFTSSRDIESLRVEAENCLLKNFRYVIYCDEFKHLTLLELSDVFQIARDSSVKICESLYFKAVVEWVKHNSERNKYFVDLFELVEIERLKADYLANTIAQEELVMTSFHCMQRLVGAFRAAVGTSGMDVLDTSNVVHSPQRLIEQRELFSQCFTDQEVGMWYVICSEWMDKWVKYVTNDGYDWASEMRRPDFPGPVDNSSLFTNSSCKILKRTLRPSIDYKFIPETAWQLLCSWYGEVEGQPPVGEKGPIFKQSEQKQALDFLDDDCVIDPIQLLLKCKHSKKSCKCVFSKWDKLDDVDKKMRRIFKIAKQQKTFLWNDFSLLDKSKCIADYTFEHNEVQLICMQPESEETEGAISVKEFYSQLKTSEVSKDKPTTSRSTSVLSSVSKDKPKNALKSSISSSILEMKKDTRKLQSGLSGSVLHSSNSIDASQKNSSTDIKFLEKTNVSSKNIGNSNFRATFSGDAGKKFSLKPVSKKKE